MPRFIKTRMDKKKSSQKVNSSQIKNKNRTSGSDITMCKGGKCPFKDMCHRYTALPDEQYQSYFAEPPFRIKNGKPECEMYWGEAVQQLFVMLKEIMEHPIPKKKKQR